MQVRVTKYNPAFRDDNGEYLAHDWTYCSDIGKVFSGASLTANDYLEIEHKYVHTLCSILTAYGIKAMRISELHNDVSGPYDLLLAGVPECLTESSREMLENVWERSEMCNGQTLEKSLFRDVFRLCLREVLWMKLESTTGGYVHFGYDYYVYVGVDAKPTLWSIEVPDGIFIECCSSPYRESWFE
ncbi:MAG: hypothetical protein ACLFUJ_09080 [Phycisphaerae bacterium]